MTPDIGHAKHLPLFLSHSERCAAMRQVGRLLQLVGLIVLPLSIVLQLQAAITLRDMLALLVVGTSAFWIGRLVEGYAPR